jgi:hypothetical protein
MLYEGRIRIRTKIVPICRNTDLQELYSSSSSKSYISVKEKKSNESYMIIKRVR